MARRIGILGGTFDPIHIGHLAIANDVCWALPADQMIFVPTAQQPLKHQRHAATAAHRLAMVQQAIADNPCFAASDLEVQRGGLSYTIDTIRELQSLHPDADLFFVVGADAASDLPRWYKINEVMQRCRLAIVRRPGYELHLDYLIDTLRLSIDQISVIDGPALDISASEIRARLGDGRPTRYLLPASVSAYIEQHDVYGEHSR